MSNSVKIGIAGAGVFGGYHASKYASHDMADLTAVFDPDHGRAQALADKHGAHAVDQFEAMIEHVDAVVVAAPATYHFDLADRALRAGRHVFVEKPIALDVADANALVARARDNNLVMQVGHQERFVFDAVGLLDRATSPLKIDCVRSGPASGRCEDVSVVFDLMVHDIDLVRQLTKSGIRILSAKGDEASVKAELTLENGAIITMTASRCAPSLERRMSLVYDDGFVEFDFVNRTLNNSTPAVLADAFGSEDAPLALRDPLGFGAEAFLKAIQQHSVPLVSGEAGRDAVEWAARIEAAAGLASSESENAERLRA